MSKVKRINRVFEKDYVLAMIVPKRDKEPKRNYSNKRSIEELGCVRFYTATSVSTLHQVFSEKPKRFIKKIQKLIDVLKDTPSGYARVDLNAKDSVSSGYVQIDYDRHFIKIFSCHEISTYQAKSVVDLNAYKEFLIASLTEYLTHYPKYK